MVSIGGAMGAVLRHTLASAITVQLKSEFPLGIFTVNVLGCFLMVICYVLLVERQLLGDPWLDFTLAGLLGAFTTFSTFSIQAYMLIVNGRRALALGYIMASVLVCLLAVAVGVFLTRTLINH
ncbi:MAG: fluoride efflux transporter CrcB [Gammaproteobacteria bacterium]|nr:fluoride efflux transporter CrcB [Gammaproteobacteria bacterium]